MEQFCLALGSQVDAGFICAEKRNPGLDRALLEAWDELLARPQGTGTVSAQSIYERFVGIEIRDKKPNIPGLQLADLVATPIGRHLAGMPAKPNEVQWSIVERKLWRVNGTYLGRGLVVRP